MNQSYRKTYEQEQKLLRLKDIDAYKAALSYAIGILKMKDNEANRYARENLQSFYE